MPRCHVNRALKCGGVRHAPGATVTLTDRDLSSLDEGTVTVLLDDEALRADQPSAPIPSEPDAQGSDVAPLAAPSEAAQHTGGGPVGGPTLEEYVAAGYKAENYPPEGYAEKPSAGLTAFRAGGGTPSTSRDPAADEDEGEPDTAPHAAAPHAPTPKSKKKK